MSVNGYSRVAVLFVAAVCYHRNMTKSKLQQLRMLEQQIIRQDTCPQLRQQATQLVMGSGSVEAAYVFIGEAPGKQEDLQGKPFIGAAGKFLDEMLAAAGMNREDVYITNIVKYRPPNNRDPLPTEKQAFWPFLLRELAIIQPQAIVTLGRHSMEYFLPGASISEVHGQPQRVIVGDHQLTIVPLYHPAAALYNGSLRQTLMDDFTHLPAQLAPFNA